MSLVGELRVDDCCVDDATNTSVRGQRVEDSAIVGF